MKLKLLENDFSVCKIKDGTAIDWSDKYLFVGKTDEEFSLVCSTKCVPKEYEECENGWRGFRIEGVLDFSMIGILAKVSGLLAEHGISIFVSSTYNTDYILVKEDKIEETITLLRNAGYQWI